MRGLKLKLYGSVIAVNVLTILAAYNMDKVLCDNKLYKVVISKYE